MKNSYKVIYFYTVIVQANNKTEALNKADKKIYKKLGSCYEEMNDKILLIKNKYEEKMDNQGTQR